MADGSSRSSPRHRSSSRSWTASRQNSGHRQPEVGYQRLRNRRQAAYLRARKRLSVGRSPAPLCVTVPRGSKAGASVEMAEPCVERALTARSVQAAHWYWGTRSGSPLADGCTRPSPARWRCRGRLVESSKSSPNTTSQASRARKGGLADCFGAAVSRRADTRAAFAPSCASRCSRQRRRASRQWLTALIAA
jgi:hypothetical protein